jgi:hypothetical protein
MRIAKLGAVATLIVVTVLALLWVTEAMPRADVERMAPKAIGAIVVLVAAAVVLSMLRGSPTTRDDTDKPVP